MSAQPVTPPTAGELVNLRDLGGLSLIGGGRSRPRLLWRSGAPLAGDQAPALSGWPPATVIDLRGADELTGPRHPLAGPHTTVHALPLLDASVTPGAGALEQVGGPAMTPTGGDQGHRGIDWSGIPDLATAYLGFLDQGAATITRILNIVATHQAPMLIHCTAGKDRTGVVVAVLLRAAGVTRAAITTDYRATEPALPAILARAAHLTAGLDPTVVQRLMGAPASAITAVLDHLDHAPGGASGWLLAAGADPARLSSWRQRITTPHAS